MDARVDARADARVRPAHEGVFTARPEQMYDGPPPCPSELAWPTVAEAVERARYWRSPHEHYRDRPLESTYVFPAAVGEAELMRMKDEQFPPCPLLASAADAADGAASAVASGDKRVPADRARLLPAHAEILLAARKNPALTAGRRILERGGADADALICRSLMYAVRVVGSGIFVRISGGRLSQFLPFTTWDSSNRWGPAMPVAGGVSPRQFVERLARQARRPMSEFVGDPSRWVAGSGDVVGLEKWTGRAVSGKVAEFAYLLWLTLSRFRVPDCAFIYNRRDTPVVRSDPSLHPHFHLFDRMDEPLSPEEALTHEGGALPFLSESTICEAGADAASPAAAWFVTFADIPVPTQDDVCLGSGLAFVHSRKQVPRPPDISDAELARLWARRRPTAVFRGAATGVGVDDAVARGGKPANFNQRLVVARLGAQCAARKDCSPGGAPLLDAGITSFNARPRKTLGFPLAIVDVRRLGCSRADFLDSSAQGSFRYQLYIDGHSVAFRMPSLMLSGHLVLRVVGRVGHAAWWSPLLRAGVHFVPVRADMSDLLDQIRWCREHDAEAQKIAAAGRAVMLELFPPPPAPPADADGMARHRAAAAGCEYLAAYMASVLRAIAPRQTAPAAA